MALTFAKYIYRYTGQVQWLAEAWGPLFTTAFSPPDPCCGVVAPKKEKSSTRWTCQRKFTLMKRPVSSILNYELVLKFRNNHIVQLFYAIILYYMYIYAGIDWYWWIHSRFMKQIGYVVCFKFLLRRNLSCR